MSATLSDVRKKSPAYQAGAFFGMARSVANRVVPAASIIVSLDEMLVRDLLQVMRSEKIKPSTLGLLMYLKLNTGDEYISDIIRTYLFEYTTESGKNPCDILDEAGYIKYTKTGAKSRPWERVRLSEKGEQILKEMHQRLIHPLAELTLNYTKEQYNRIGAEKHISGGGKLS